MSRAGVSSPLTPVPLSRRHAVLETSRTRLCIPVPADAEITRGFVQDEAVTRFMGHSGRTLEEERLQIQKHIRTHHDELGYGLFLVVDRETGEPLGRAGIHHGPVPEIESLEINYLIVPEHRGKGLAREVVEALVEWARDEHGIRRLAAFISPDNAPSIRVAEHAGFRRVDEVDYPLIGRALRYVWESDD